MKYLLPFLIVSFLSASECGNKKTMTTTITETKEIAKDSIPACVRKLIDEGNKNELSTAPMQVEEYLYNGKKVFLFTAPCCDQFNTLYDDSCKVLCAPSGGFTGKGDQRCPDFFEKAKLVKKVWENPSK